MSQTIDLAAAVSATFNGTDLGEIKLNSASCWTKPSSGPTGDWLLTVSDPRNGSDTWFGHACQINHVANIFGIVSYMSRVVDFFDATTGQLLFSKQIDADAADGILWRYPASIDISETHIVIGWTSGTADNKGCVSLYDLSGNLLNVYFPPTSTPCWEFGCAVAIEGDIVVIGSGRTAYVTGSLASGYDNGRAYIYNLSGALLHTLTPANTSRSWLRFGGEVRVSGDYVLIGNEAIDGDGSGNDHAEINLFNTSGVRLWTLLNPHPDFWTYSWGASIAMSGDRIVVAGATGLTALGGSQSSLRVYDLAGNQTAYVHRFASEETYGAVPWQTSGGNKIDMDGDNIIVSNPWSGSSIGHMYLFNTDLEEIKFIQAPTPTPSTGFGLSIAISGNKIVSGQRDGFTPYTLSKAFVFT